MYLVIAMPELKLQLISIGLAQLITTRRHRTEDDDISCHIAQHLKHQSVFSTSHCVHQVHIYRYWDIHAFYTYG